MRSLRSLDRTAWLSVALSVAILVAASVTIATTVFGLESVAGLSSDAAFGGSIAVVLALGALRSWSRGDRRIAGVHVVGGVAWILVFATPTASSIQLLAMLVVALAGLSMVIAGLDLEEIRDRIGG